MRRDYRDLIVGLFMLAGFAVFVYISLQFGEFSIFEINKTTKYLARFTNVSGLKKGANVEIAGVVVGKISEITLNDKEQAVVALLIDKNIAISDDTIASIRTMGIIGDKFVKILPGGSDKILKSGEMLYETESAVDIEELISKYLFGNLNKNDKL